MAPTHALYDVNPFALTICKKGANRQRIFLKKSADEPDVVLPAPHRLLKTADWSAFYCVVAEPGAEEDPGQGDGAGTETIDIWKSEDEIRQAAHRFALNKGYVNAMHDAFEEHGCAVVENAVALADFDVDGQTIKKGSWYVAVQPSDEFKAQVDSGEITGVSLEGTGFREELAKAPSKYIGAKKCPKCNSKVATERGACPNCGESVKKTHGDEGGKQAGPLKHLISHYMKKPHPFTACVRDNRKRFGPRTEAVCAGLKDVATGTHNWRGKGKGKIHKSDDAEAALTASLADRWYESGLTDEDAQMALDAVRAADERSLLHEIGAKVGLIEDEPCCAGCDETGPDHDDIRKSVQALDLQAGNVGSTNEEDADAVNDNERLEKLEKSADDTKSAIASLTGLVEKLVEHSTKKEEPETPTADALKKSLDDFTGEVSEKLNKMADDIDSLAAGASSQDTQPDTIRKTNPDPLAGLLS